MSDSDFHISIKIPAKVIISGEFSCVFGCSVITCPIPLFLCIESNIKSNQQNKGQTIIKNKIIGEMKISNNINEINNLSNENKIKDCFLKVYGHAINFYNIQKLVTEFDIDISLESEAPIGMGLGSSAAFILSLFSLCKILKYRSDVKNPLSFTQEETNEMKLVENIFHGKSSGIDIISIASGCLGFYEKSNDEWRIKESIKEPNPPFYLLLINSNKSKNTIESLKDVLEKVANESIAMKSIEDISDITTEIFSCMSQGNLKTKFHKLLKKNHSHLKELSVSCESIDDIVDYFDNEEFGCKLTGGGRGGFAITIFSKEEHSRISEIVLNLNQKGYECTEILLDSFPQIIYTLEYL